MFEGEEFVWFGLRLKGRSLKNSTVEAIHEMLAEVWEPGYVGGDQQRQGIGCNLFLNLYEYNY